MDTLPQFSVFVPNFNHGKFIGEALDALLAQSLQPRAIYIVDDCSTDDSRDVIARYISMYPHVQVTHLPENLGVIKNMNDWLLTVDDDYVYFASADDVVLPGFFEKSLRILSSYPDAGLVSSLTLLIGANGEALGAPKSPRPLSGAGFLSPTDVADNLYSDDSWINGNTVIYHRKTLLSVGGFPPALEGFADGFAFRLVALAKGACFIEEPLAKWRLVSSGYASRTSNSADIALKVAQEAGRLMNGAYANLFPEGYSQRWRQRWLFGAVMGQLALPAQCSYENICKLLGPSHRIERLAIRGIVSMPLSGAKRLLALLYFSIKMRPYDITGGAYRRATSVFRGRL